jgi:solute:Na+ symporter, SSS family
MSGMAGNVTAFNTVWTYDIYQSLHPPGPDDQHYLWMGRMATVFGIGASIGTAYVAMQFNNIMDLLQLVFAFVNAPLFATFLLGMFWKRATGHGAFSGLVAIWAWSVCFAATIAISLLTAQKKTDEDLEGLVYALTPLPSEGHLPWWQTPAGVGAIVLALAVALNAVFW